MSSTKCLEQPDPIKCIKLLELLAQQTLLPNLINEGCIVLKKETAVLFSLSVKRLWSFNFVTDSSEKTSTCHVLE